MGGSYGNVLVLTTTQAPIANAITGESAYIAMFDGVGAVFSQTAASDPQTSALQLSADLDCDALGFFVFDDDVLGCWLCRSGETIAQVSVPTMAEYTGIDPDEMELMAEYLDESAPNAGATDDAPGFVLGVGRGDARQALFVLGDDYQPGQRIWATERHRDLLDALGLPTAIAGWDYYAFDSGITGFEGPTPTYVSS